MWGPLCRLSSCLKAWICYAISAQQMLWACALNECAAARASAVLQTVSVKRAWGLTCLCAQQKVSAWALKQCTQCCGKCFTVSGEQPCQQYPGGRYTARATSATVSGSRPCQQYPGWRHTGRQCLQVADFGLSRKLNIQSKLSTETVGTITHMPPELLIDGVMSKAGDVFAFGVLLW